MTFVGVDPGLPLGVPADAAYPVDGVPGGYAVTEVGFPAGSGLVLYTDGLVEDREVPVGAGMERLESGMAMITAASADEMCDAALQVTGRLDSHDDDTAVLALLVPSRVAGADGAADSGLRRVVLANAGPPAAAASRDVVRRLLADGPLHRLEETAALLVSELVTNALRHGGGPPGGVAAHRPTTAARV